MNAFGVPEGIRTPDLLVRSIIDVLSISTIIAAAQGEYQNYNYLALSGTTKKQSIFHHLEQQT